MDIKIKMKRHESFSIREGWLAKGLIAIKNDPKVFSSPNATDILGIGTNMVKSLKYWMLATKLIEEKNRNIVLTELGEIIYEHDLYLEDNFTWWLIHINLLLNLDDAYIFNTFFNKCNYSTFSKKNIFEQICNLLTLDNYEYNEKTLQDEINMIIKTYSIDEKIENLENNFICPLSELSLIKKIDRDTYERIKPTYKDLHYLIVYYNILNILNDKEYIGIDELFKIDNSPVKLLNLDKNLLNEYLDEMKRNELILINRTAGLNMIYLNRKLSLTDISLEYYHRGVKNEI